MRNEVRIFNGFVRTNSGFWINLRLCNCFEIDEYVSEIEDEYEYRISLQWDDVRQTISETYNSKQEAQDALDRIMQFGHNG